jgi:hypothetical protein
MMYGIRLRKKKCYFINAACVTCENNIQKPSRFSRFFANAPDMTEYFAIQRNEELHTLNIILAKYFYE